MKIIKCRHGEECLVDDSDYPELSKHTWWVKTCKSKYADQDIKYAFTNLYANNTRVRVYMHQLVLKVDAYKLVDHKNHNGLDNTRLNLRECTNTQNRHNSRARYGGFKGITFTRGRWQAYCEKTYLGKFIDPVEAAKAYDRVAKERFGEFALLNFPAGA